MYSNEMLHKKTKWASLLFLDRIIVSASNLEDVGLAYAL
jgi:hypothetical protein